MLFFKAKDGGEHSTVTGYWLIESKKLFSICLLHFDGASREAFHSHAFNSIAWVLKGKLIENMLDGSVKIHEASWKPFKITREDFHKVDSEKGSTWVLNLRGPWFKSWYEYLPLEERFRVLTRGRVEVVAQSD